MDTVTQRPGLHWLRFVTDHSGDEVRSLIGGRWAERGQGRFNQAESIEHESGLSVHFGSDRKDQPVVVEVPGGACELVPWRELCGWAVKLAGRPTRVDLANDVGPDEVATSRLIEMRQAFAAGRCTTRIPSSSHDWIESGREGEGRTLYVGSRSSSQFLRAYDRRGPLRLEWQTAPPREVREEVLSTLIEYGPDGMWRRFAHRCIWPFPWYRQLLDGPAGPAHAGSSDALQLHQFLRVFVHQWGKHLQALKLLGADLNELAVPFNGRLSFAQQKRYLGWCREAQAYGWEDAGVTALQREIERCQLVESDE